MLSFHPRESTGITNGADIVYSFINNTYTITNSINKLGPITRRSWRDRYKTQLETGVYCTWFVTFCHSPKRGHCAKPRYHNYMYMFISSSYSKTREDALRTSMYQREVVLNVWNLHSVQGMFMCLVFRYVEAF